MHPPGHMNLAKAFGVGAVASDCVVKSTQTGRRFLYCQLFFKQTRHSGTGCDIPIARKRKFSIYREVGNNFS